VIESFPHQLLSAGVTSRRPRLSRGEEPAVVFQLNLGEKK